MKTRINFIENDNKLTIRVKPVRFIADLVSYIATTSILGVPLILFLRYGGSYASTTVIVLLVSIVLIYAIFVLRYFFNVQEVRITNTGGSYQFNNREIYEIKDIKNFMVYKFVGESLIDSYGHLYLTVGHDELLLSYNLTYEEILSVTQRISKFLEKDFQLSEKELL